jgi:hypothetical protein
MAPTDTVLLIDLENMIGANAKPGMLAMKLDVLTSKAGASVPAVAACAGSRISPAGEQVLRDRQIRLLKVNGHKDAADKALLEEAERLAGRGCKRFVVASHDSRFGQLADLGEFEIVAWTSPKIAQKYGSKATAVHRMARPNAASPAKPAPSGQAPKAQAEPASSLPPQKVAMPTDKPAPPARPRVRAVSVTAVGGGILAAGILFGAGTVIGASAVLRLLRQPDHR